MSVDISKIKVGDKVTLAPLEVMDIDFERLRLKGYGGPVYIHVYGVAAHHPTSREFQVGDRVFVDKERTPRVIGAVFMDVALLDVAGSPEAFNFRRLTLVEP